MRIRGPGWKNSDLGSGIEKSRIWINISDPQHLWAVVSFSPVVRGIWRLIIITFPDSLLWKLHTFRGKVPGVYYPVKVMSLILCSATSPRLWPSSESGITTDVLGRHLTVETERIKNILKIYQ